MSRKKPPSPLPPLPDELAYLWAFYLRLARRRQAGMSANPLTYAELEAFERKALVRFTAWEADLLMRVDDAVLAAWAGERPAPKPAQGEPVEVSDPQNVKALFRGLATRKRLERAAKP